MLNAMLVQSFLSTSSRRSARLGFNEAERQRQAADQRSCPSTAILPLTFFFFLEMSSPDSDTSSLYTLTDSIRQHLYRFQGERRFQGVNDAYQ